MRAAVFYGRHDIRIEEMETPSPGPGQALVKVACCGICGFDLHIWEGDDIAVVKDRTAQNPRVLGHEYAGTVIKVGEGVTTCKVGDRVTVAPYAACGKCFFCRNGIENYCTDKTLSSGAWAEYTVAPQAAVYGIPNDMPFELASLSEPLSCCLHAMDRAQIRGGSSVCIIGGGPIGLMLLALVKAGGASHVIVSEPVQVRRELAIKLGADIVVNPVEQDLSEIVSSKTRGVGVDYTFEAVGKASAVLDAVDVVRNSGTIVIVGVAIREDTMQLSPFEIYSRELSITGSFSRSYAFDRTIRLLPSLNLDPLITQKLGLNDIVMAITDAQKGKGAKILVEP
jgi:2-desacetyl-2-hydroxyethyl bacteriochlorophyllide A dehydrogenase